MMLSVVNRDGAFPDKAATSGSGRIATEIRPVCSIHRLVKVDLIRYHRGVKRQGEAMIEKLREINGGRTLLMNVGVLFCIIIMLGLANLICRFVLKTDLTYLMPWLIGAAVVYCFGPALALWCFTGSPSGDA